MKKALLSILALGLFHATAQTTKPLPITGRYHVVMNMEKGLVVEVWQPFKEYTNIPSSQSHVGGGGRSIISETWKSTGKQVFIAHTKETQDFATDLIFYANTTPASRGYRISPVEVIPVLTLNRFLPPPPGQSPQKTSPLPPKGPENPFLK